MAAMMERLLKKNLNAPDETRAHEGMRAEVVTLGEIVAMRVTLAPGWRWSTNLKPRVQTDSCQVMHIGYAVSGTMHVLMDNGVEVDVVPGDVVIIPPGHDAWVVGEEPFVIIDFTGGKVYAKQFDQTGEVERESSSEKDIKEDR